MTSIIQVEQVSKHFKVLNRREGLFGSVRDLFSSDYRTVKAVDAISMSVNAGEIVGYIGPNGAGKSTTIKMMTGILKPTSGVITVNGLAPYEHRQRNAQFIGVVFGQRTQLWWDLPVIESFRILKEIYRVDEATYKRNLQVFEDLVQLSALYGKTARTLSLGQRMLCDIAASFLHSPRIVFLDEPTIGLDISIKSKIRDLIRTLNSDQKVTIILTTHDIGDIEALCKRVIIIDKGKIIFDDAMERVKHLFGAYRTLKVQVMDTSTGTSASAKLNGGFEASLRQQFGQAHADALSIASEDEGWIAITIDQEQIPLRDVLNFAMNALPVNDIKITEIATESVIRKVYDGVDRETESIAAL